MSGRLSVLFGVLLLSASLKAPAAQSGVPHYLHAPGSFEAEYVVLAPDPAYDTYGQRLQAAMHEHAEWLQAYVKQHPNQSPLPYHSKFGVPRDQYERYQSPENQYLEVSRQRIRIDLQQEGAHIRLTLRGPQLLVESLVIDTATPGVATPRGRVPFRERQSPGRASMPPGATEGLGFMSDTDTIVKRRFRETILIGRLTGTSKGIIRYSLNTPGKVAYAYITYDLKP
jgi:hypothetical protein